MAFNLVSLGLTENSITADALKEIKKSDEVYLENYTVNFPYNLEDLEKQLNRLIEKCGRIDDTKFATQSVAEQGGRAKNERVLGGDINSQKEIKITSLERSKVEDESILKDAKEKNITLLVYGDALSATTHTQLILACKKQKIHFKIFHNASILTAISNTGLSLYKFGKTASMPSWEEHTNKPTSFLNYLRENLSIKAHSLLLIDIGLELENAISQLEESLEKYETESGRRIDNIKLATQSVAEQGGRAKYERVLGGDINSQKFPNKIIVISNAGTEKEKIVYETLENLKSIKIEKPYALIIPSELSEHEKEFLKNYAN